jgi:hypothetical protein
MSMTTKLSKVIRALMLGTIVFAPVALAASPTDSDRTSEQHTDRETLLLLNAELAHSQIVDRDPTFISKVALENFRVLAPGGLIENKEQAIAGLAAWDATDVTLSDTDVLFHGDVAIVMGRMDIDGIMRPVGRWGPLKYMSTWVKEDGEWRLLSRSLTPCLDKLIELGRC